MQTSTTNICGDDMIRPTAAWVLANKYMRIAEHIHDPDGWNMTWSVAITRDPDWDLYPILRVVTRYTSLPLTVTLIDKMNESRVQKRMWSRHRLAYLVPTGILGSYDPQDVALCGLDEPVTAAKIAIEVCSGFEKPRFFADVCLGEEPEIPVVEVAVITCSERPTGWPR